MPPKVLNLPHLKPKTLKTKSIFSSILMLTAFAVSAFSTNPVKHRYSFNLKGLHNTKCYMGFYYGDKSYVLDSADVDDKGNFHFEGDSVLPGGVYFVLLKDKRYFEFIIDKEQRFTMRTDTGDFIKSMKVEGSPENQLFYNYLNYAATQYQKLQKIEDSAKTPAQKKQARIKSDSLNNAVKKYKDDLMAKHPDYFLSKIFKAAEYPDVPETPILPNGRKDSSFAYRWYKAHYFDNIDLSDDRMAHTPSQIFFDRIKEYMTKLTFQIPDSINVAADYIINKARKSPDMFKFLVNWISFTYESSNIMGMDAVFVHMVKTYYTPQVATWESPSHIEKMQERAAQLEPILIGKPAIPLVLPDTSNVMTDMQAIRARYTILFFWDYDCGLCQKEIPKLKKWYDSVKGQGYEVYGVEISENLDITKWKDFIKTHKLNWINVADIFHTSNFRHDYDVISTPMIYVLDENKVIIAKKIDVGDLDGVLRHDMQRVNTLIGQNNREPINTNQFPNNKEDTSSLSSRNKSNTVIKLTRKKSGVYSVHAKINDLPLDFILDTGSDDVSISLTEALFMLKNGYLKGEDILGNVKSSLADGSIQEGTKIIIRKIEIGGLILYNVKATVEKSLDAPLLLGQSALSKLGKIQLDYKNSTLTIIQ